MKKILGIVLLGVILGGFVSVKSALAVSNYQSGQEVTLQKSDTINSDFFAAGRQVILNGVVNGDAYVAGNSVTINGVVNGDLLAAGGNVVVNGKVTGNIRVVGGQVVVLGIVGRNTTLAGGEVTIQNSAKLAGSVVAVGGNLALFAPIPKGVTFAGGQVSIDSPIKGDVNGASGQFSLLPQASVSGNVTYWGRQKALIDPRAKVTGQTIFHQTMPTRARPNDQGTSSAGILGGVSFVWALISLLTAFIIGLFLMSFAPVYLKTMSTTIITKPWLSVGIGFLILILFPIAGLVLVLTIVGIPLAVIMLMVFIIAVLLNKIFIAYAIGKKLLPKRESWALLLGLGIYGVISIIPVIGWIWSMVTLFIGLGAGAIVGNQLYRGLREKKLI